MPSILNFTRHRATLVTGLLLCGLAGGGLVQSQPQVHAQEANPELAARFDTITVEVSDIRGLDLLTPLNDAYLSRDELRAQLEEMLAVDYPLEEQAADSRVLATFGLIPVGTDLGQLLVDLYSEQILGFYDPATDEMYVIGAATGDLSALDEVTYAHETVHALQDQHFDLEAGALAPDDRNDDATLAVSGLVEGDATSAQTDYIGDHPMLLLRFLGEIATFGIDMGALDAAPPIISRTLAFPYDDGFNFVTALRDDAGWEAVNAAFSDPPRSTEQILHPDKYLAAEEPVEISLPDIGAALGTGWTLLDDNVVGEFTLQVLLAGSGNDEAIALEAAAGWGGDRYEVWANGDQTVLTWQSAWDSAADAEAFAAAMRAYDESRYGATYTTDSEGTLALTSGAQTTLLRLDGDTVYYTFAPSETQAQDLFALLTTGV